MEIELKYLVDSKETIEKIFSDGYLCEIKEDVYKRQCMY